MDSSQKSMLLCREQPWFELRIKETSFSLQEIQFSRIFSRLLHSSQGLDELLYSSGPYRISTKHSFICQELSILTWLFLGALSNHEISFILCYQTGELVEDAKMWHPPQSLLRANFLKLIFIFWKPERYKDRYSKNIHPLVLYPDAHNKTWPRQSGMPRTRFRSNMCGSDLSTSTHYLLPLRVHTEGSWTGS